MSAEEPMSIGDNSESSPSSNKRPKTEKDGAPPAGTSDPDKSPQSLESGVPGEDGKSDEELENADYESGSEYDFEMPSDFEEEEEMVAPTPMERIKSYDASNQTKPSVSGFDKLCMAKKRLIRDCMTMKKESLMEGSAAPDSNDVLKWKGWLFGPPDSPFEDGSFFIKLLFSEEYPFEPPQVWFQSKMFHPNIFADGEISTRALKQSWSPASNVADLLRVIYHLLSEPYKGYVVNSEAWNLYSKDRLTYNSRVRACVKASLEQDVDDAMTLDTAIADTGEKAPEPEKGEFEMLEKAPSYHKFLSQTPKKSVASTPKNVTDHIRKKDLPLLVNTLPAGIYVKGFEDRLDLFSVMMRGPEKTPYQDFLFFFDIMLPNTYPSTPPVVHFYPPREEGKTVAVSGFRQRINPNLYDCGKVCLSLLGTWTGPGWNPGVSTILQVLISIQGLIFVEEPFYNEPGYKPGKHYSASRNYSETVVLRLTRCLSTTINSPPAIFTREVEEHFRLRKARLLDLLEGWLEISEKTWSNKKTSGGTPSSAAKKPSSSKVVDPYAMPKKYITVNTLAQAQALHQALSQKTAQLTGKLQALGQGPGQKVVQKELGQVGAKLGAMGASLQAAKLGAIQVGFPSEVGIPGYWQNPSKIPPTAKGVKSPQTDSSKSANPPPAHSTKKSESKPVHPAQPGYAAAKLKAEQESETKKAGIKAHPASKQPPTNGPVSAAMLADALKAAVTSVSPLGPAAGPSSQSGSAFEDDSISLESWLAKHGLDPLSVTQGAGFFQPFSDQPSTSAGTGQGLPSLPPLPPLPPHLQQMHQQMLEGDYDDDDDYFDYDDDDDDYYYPEDVADNVMIGSSTKPPPSSGAGMRAYFNYIGEAIESFGKIDPPTFNKDDDTLTGLQHNLGKAGKILSRVSQIAKAAAHIHPTCKEKATHLKLMVEQAKEMHSSALSTLAKLETSNPECYVFPSVADKASCVDVMTQAEKCLTAVAPFSAHLAAFKATCEHQGYHQEMALLPSGGTSGSVSSAAKPGTSGGGTTSKPATSGVQASSAKPGASTTEKPDTSGAASQALKKILPKPPTTPQTIPYPAGMQVSVAYIGAISYPQKICMSETGFLVPCAGGEVKCTEMMAAAAPAPGKAPSKTAPGGAASSGLNPLYEGWLATSGTAPPKATGSAPTPGPAPSKTAPGGAASSWPAYLKEALGAASGTAPTAGAAATGTGASGLPSALSKAYSVFQDAPYLVYGRKPRTDEVQPEAIKEAAKKAAEQTRRPLPSFPLIPIQEANCSKLKAAIDKFRELLERNDFNSSPSPSK